MKWSNHQDKRKGIQVDKNQLVLENIQIVLKLVKIAIIYLYFLVARKNNMHRHQIYYRQMKIKTS